MRSMQRIYHYMFELLSNIFQYKSIKDSSAEDLKSRKKVLDPQGPFLQKWNKIFVLSCVVAISVDPLFFYIPFVNDKDTCVDLDENLVITASVLRSFTDIFYVLHIIFQFRTGFIAPPSRVFGRGVLVEDFSAIALRYLKSYFLIDILAVIPLPQVARLYDVSTCAICLFWLSLCWSLRNFVRSEFAKNIKFSYIAPKGIIADRKHW